MKQVNHVVRDTQTARWEERKEGDKKAKGSVFDNNKQ